ncbi:hypothetical protein K8353_01410 [Burkholderia contaminans]|nr:hypothetical protein [Burkholderia contaminans]
MAAASLADDITIHPTQDWNAMDSSENLAFGTPTLTVLSNRGALVRTLTYNRQVANAGLDERIEQTVHSSAGFVASRIDARLFSAGGKPNFTYTTSLTGRVLRADGVDAGVTVTLADVDGRPAWAHDARGTTAEWTYDLLGRPLSAREAIGDAAFETRDRWVYGEGEPDAQTHNLRGQCVRRYDTAGRLSSSDFTLNGQPLDQTRRLLADSDANWSGDNEAAWVAALDATAYPTTWTYGATDAWLTQTDAKSNVQIRAFDVAGKLASSSLRRTDGERLPVLSAIDYSAAGQVLSETAGNGVIMHCEYEPETQRLVRLSATRPAQAHRSPVLQDLRYEYDPVGNILSMRDDVQATTYWRNQKVEPTRTYAYDALYQLMSATGREMVDRGQQGTGLPEPIIPLPTDDSVYTNYTRTYAYDRGGNLTQILHRGAVNYTQEIVVSDRSNHALLQNAAGTITPASVDDGTWFDQSGNQRMLLPDRLQRLSWNERSRLTQVTLIQRDGLPDDQEMYRYGADGMRICKQSRAYTGSVTRMSDVIYLPGLTLRTTRSNDGRTEKVVEALQEVIVDAGRSSIRNLHWESGQPQGIANDTTCYGIGDLIGSIGIELDDNAEFISREEYYPYGGTAVWMARSAVEANTKYVRYAGKERDATGLYDYGWRSYQPWIGRWLSADPAGSVDGLNLFKMVRNNPVTHEDVGGLAPPDVIEEIKKKFVWEEHIPAIEEASRKGRFAVSFRAAGAPTIAALALGAAAKGHDILEKTIKPSSIQKAYPETHAEVLSQVRSAGIEGYVGHWENGGLVGIYMSSGHGLGDAVVNGVYPINIGGLEESLQALKNRPNWQSLPFTGDYDTHDMITFRGAGRPHTVLSESPEENEIIRSLNDAVGKVDPNRPPEDNEHNVIRHGPQVNYPSFMMNLEDLEAGNPKSVKREGFVGAVARPGEFPLAIVNRGKWSIVRNIEELDSFYTSVGARIKEAWKPGGSRAYVGGNTVRLGRAMPPRS